MVDGLGQPPAPATAPPARIAAATLKPPGPAWPWRTMLAAGLLLLLGFFWPVRLWIAARLVNAHDWLARTADPHHYPHPLITPMQHGLRETWNPSVQPIMLALAAVLILAGANRLGARTAIDGQHPLASFFMPSNRAWLITGGVALAVVLGEVALMHWQPDTGRIVLSAAAKVAGSLATFAGKTGW